MATLELIAWRAHRHEITDGKGAWIPIEGRPLIHFLPQIIWQDNTPWREANLWALQQAEGQKNLRTVKSSMAALHAYATWLESSDLSWRHFPAKKADRCLVRFRGELIAAIKEERLAPSTAQQRMAALIRFYRWIDENRLLETYGCMWNDRKVTLHLHDDFGFKRTLQLKTTDLGIPNRSRPGERLEDGLLPISIVQRDAILSFAREHASYELHLLLWLGFRTGMRLGTLLDLKIATLQHAAPDPEFTGWHRISVGPGARPAVHTKFGVTGQVWIEKSDLEMLKQYAFSTRRLKRAALAAAEHRQHVFLTRYGSPYGNHESESSTAINVEMGRLRKAGMAFGVSALRGFHFHQSRCTFATELARLLLEHGTASSAINVVKAALLHRNESTTLRYIRFVEETPIKSAAADAFTRAFLGLTQPSFSHATKTS